VVTLFRRTKFFVPWQRIKNENQMKHLTAIWFLTEKSGKVLRRKRSSVRLVFGSTLLIFVGLYAMWVLSGNQMLHFMSSNNYDKLSFELSCAAFQDYLKCSPSSRPPPDSASRGLTLTQVAFNELRTGMLLGNKKDAVPFLNLLSSILMNGVPLLNLDDFVYLSDFVNKELGSTAKKELLSQSEYKHKFSNILNVRSNKIFLYPDSCWARQFIYFLNQTSNTLQSEINFKVFNSQKQALRHCCKNVWAIIHIGADYEQPLNVAHYDRNASSCNRTGLASRYPCDIAHERKQRSGDSFDVATSTSTTGSASVQIGDSPTVPYHASPCANQLHGISASSSAASLSTSNTTISSCCGDGTLSSCTETKRTTGTGHETKSTCPEEEEGSTPVPTVTLRMHPSAVPDTRSTEYSPINRHTTGRQDSGQVLYFTSGFLTLQLELQNYFKWLRLPGFVTINSDAFSTLQRNTNGNNAFFSDNIALQWLVVLSCF
jgi:hypothetical protein